MRPAAPLLLAALALAAAFLAAPAAACCCPGDACPGCGIGETIFYGIGEVASAPFASIVSGRCNVFGCNCDRCYPNFNCVKEYRRRLASVASVAGSAGRALLAAPGPGAACEDLPAFLNQTADDRAKSLTRTFCDASDPAANVGPEFTAAAVEVLDHDADGAPITCAEWEIAGRKATRESLPAGGHLGRTKLPKPACKMTDKGKQEWEAMNAHLADLKGKKA